MCLAGPRFHALLAAWTAFSQPQLYPLFLGAASLSMQLLYFWLGFYCLAQSLLQGQSYSAGHGVPTTLLFPLTGAGGRTPRRRGAPGRWRSRCGAAPSSRTGTARCATRGGPSRAACRCAWIGSGVWSELRISGRVQCPPCAAGIFMLSVCRGSVALVHALVCAVKLQKVPFLRELFVRRPKMPWTASKRMYGAVRTQNNMSVSSGSRAGRLDRCPL